jgi:hypothetical protein
VINGGHVLITCFEIIRIIPSSARRVVIGEAQTVEVLIVRGSGTSFVSACSESWVGNGWQGKKGR